LDADNVHRDVLWIHNLHRISGNSVDRHDVEHSSPRLVGSPGTSASTPRLFSVAAASALPWRHGKDEAASSHASKHRWGTASIAAFTSHHTTPARTRGPCSLAGNVKQSVVSVGFYCATLCYSVVYAVVMWAVRQGRRHGVDWGGHFHPTFARGRSWDWCKSGEFL